jgi:hypothetical protein
VRYETNLKILRRRDPTIVRIFELVPHVTVHSHNRTKSKWERYNCEGAWFLFERQVPPMGRGPTAHAKFIPRLSVASSPSCTP